MSLISDLITGGITGIISPISTAITAIFTKKEDVSLEKFKVDGQVDLSLVTAHTSIIDAQARLLSNKWMIALQALFAIPLAFYYGKIHVWDAALHLGVTDAVHGAVAQWDMWIMCFLFLHSAVTTWGRKT